MYPNQHHRQVKNVEENKTCRKDEEKTTESRKHQEEIQVIVKIDMREYYYITIKRLNHRIGSKTKFALINWNHCYLSMTKEPNSSAS